MKVKIKKLNPEAVIPTYATDGDAGMDITALSITHKPANGYIEYNTGISLEIPTGYVGLIFPRSSISKMGLQLANSVGVIDSGYRGEITFRFKRTPGPIYKPGDRIGQIMFIPFPKIEFEEVDELGKTERGDGGYGSTDTLKQGGVINE